MKSEIKVPAVGESISEATIGEWAKKSGEFVKRDEVILLLETDKASVEVVAPVDGVLTTTAKPGETVKIGAVVASIDTEGVATAGMAQPTKNTDAPKPAASSPAAAAPAKAIAPELQQHLSPATQRVVDERGLDASQIKGTGRDGRLTKADAMAAPLLSLMLRLRRKEAWVRRSRHRLRLRSLLRRKSRLKFRRFPSRAVALALARSAGSR